MAAFDHGIKIIARTTGRTLARLAGIDCQQWQPCESTLQATLERLADRVFVARQGQERFVVYFEFYTYWDEDALLDVQAKAALLSAREKLPTWSVVVVLRPRGFRSRGGKFRLEIGRKPTQALWYKEVCLWKIKPAAWWEKRPGLMALYPLCRHQKPPQEAIAHAASKASPTPLSPVTQKPPQEAIAHAAKAIERSAGSAVERADLLTVLGIFSRLGFPDIDPHVIIGREKMKESKFYQEIMEEGEQKAKRAYILETLESRFGPSARKKLTTGVTAVSSLDDLDRLFRLALRCTDLNEFRSALEER